jgi:phospholipid/cholesterol/gamma-HCH transport system ATP-binding protein
MSEPPIIDCDDLTLGYGDQIILEDVSLVIARREIVAIMGGSGCGKSTLLKAMVGLLPPMRGTVRLFGEELYAVSTARRGQLLRRTGMLFQGDALFGSLSLLDNVALPLRELTALPAPVIREIARFKLGQVGLAGFEDRRPAEISGGQRKRAGLARASVLDPEVVFCDEPTAALDPVMAAQVEETLARFRDVLGITIVAVTHDLASVQAIADRAVMLRNGRVEAAGTVAQLQASESPAVHEFMHRRSLAGRVS